ncbi:MAG: UDP-N-acetylglucosamine--N-acetylmuramyl-(pentapeptide) pyrophosphoryl-undecaprenol N-acetylglucosamine transferase [Gemmatimonadales bacterium]|nr:UDP-N-acetylglucosamine--N-acetylmuramyl-(pentapeptide) pyrophosphoryl-undecaprenol N-acetylglucosamine transferase [Gemmatimonadales bacterium]
MTTILFAGGGTGGHLMPALAMAEAVLQAEPAWRAVFAGAERGVEATVLPMRGVEHRLFPFAPIHRRQWWRNFQWPALALRLVREVDAFLDETRPDAVIGSGGYVSGPVVWRAARRGIPTGILELDVRPGVATRRLAASVDEIWLGAPEAVAALPERVRARAMVTGAPILPPDPSRRGTARERWGLADGRPVLVVTGGSQGSLAVNRLVAEWLRSGGGGDLAVIWATGRATHAEFASFNDAPRVHVVPFLDPMADAWAVADLCVARAGMMTLAELSAWGIPAVLIPLPTAAADHQTHNAVAHAAAGAAIHLPQAGLTAARLAESIAGLANNPAARAAMAAAAKGRGRPGAAREIAARITQLADRR